jgi:hypothetical protein
LLNVARTRYKAFQQLGKNRSLETTSARLLAITAPGASNWVNTIPSLPSHVLSDNHYQIAMTLRLGIQPINVMQSVCGSCCVSLNTDCRHYLSYSKRRKNELNLSHDQVKVVLAYYSVHAGIVARREPSGLSEEHQLRPDLQLLLDQHNLLIDVTIVHPTCPSHLHKSQTQFKTAHQACEAKKSKYKQLAEQQKAEFIPSPLRVLDDSLTQRGNLILTIATFANDHLSAWSKEEIITNINSAIACAVQRGNAITALVPLSLSGLLDFSCLDCPEYNRILDLNTNAN